MSEIGPRGERGDPGLRGDRGERGDGAQGATGLRGERGRDGKAGDSYRVNDRLRRLALVCFIAIMAFGYFKLDAQNSQTQTDIGVVQSAVAKATCGGGHKAANFEACGRLCDNMEKISNLRCTQHPQAVGVAAFSSTAASGGGATSSPPGNSPARPGHPGRPTGGGSGGSTGDSSSVPAAPSCDVVCQLNSTVDQTQQQLSDVLKQLGVQP